MKPTSGAPLPTFEQIESRIREACTGTLPGHQAHYALAPRPRPWPPAEPPAGTRPAAALLVLTLRDDAPHVVLTVRAGGVRHAGQVSLPGGAVDEGETIEAAALREASEEIGLPADKVRVIGPLTPLHVRVSGFEVHPVAAVCVDPPALAPAPDEVDRILEVPLVHLTDPAHLGRMSLVHLGGPVDAPYFALENERVWGATAMILSELLWILDRPVDPWAMP